ncbi:substrate-binding domain cholesterol oxidase protein [Rutstroemia sp. NJR-2017a WRK4]|nr:substrate-binding domain cholesterol oxidase protein [Rutstroemia sp. NJR-2017a WRK4]
MVSKYFKDLPAPDKENLTTEFVLQEIIDHISALQEDFPHVKLELLRRHLWEIRNRDVEPQKHLRGLLQVFEHTHTFKKAFDELDPSMQVQIKTFMKDDATEATVLAASGHGGDFHIPPSPAVKHHFTEMVKHKLEEGKEFIEGKLEHVLGKHHHDGLSATMEGSDGHVKEDKEGYPKIYEDEKQTKTMEVHKRKTFQNWGQSVKNTPQWTFVPTTILGLSNLVKWAKKEGFRVRCSGYRHSWSNTFSQDKQILVSLLNLEEVTKIPDAMSIEEEHIDPNNELKTIQLAPKIPGLDNVSVHVNGAANGTNGTNGNTADEKTLCRVGVAVTNEQFRRWAVTHNQWTMPVDVILVEVTCGGVNGPICHGAGRRHKTVNDYVRAIEYIDCNGVHRTISDPAQLLAAAGCFGLLGIVTHVTFALDKMSYAVLRPRKPDIGLAIPPLSPSDIPVALRKTWTPKQYADALAEFERAATDDYYSEWFWFTRSQQAWVNTWNNTPDEKGVVEYPSAFDTFVQWVQGWVGSVLTGNEIFQLLPGRWQACILSTFGMVALPPFEFSNFGQDKIVEIKTKLPNALHFRRGIQNMRVRDLEFQIPIPVLPSSANSPTGPRPDYTIVRRAWWDIISLCYRSTSTPMRLTLELRIMGSSNLLMAPQHGNTWGTASIEVLSIPDAVKDEEWVPFLQDVVDLWASYKGVMEIGGKEELLNVRPHWAKEWDQVRIRGREAKEYLREVAYKERIEEFRGVLGEIGKGQGWGLGDLKSRFSNELWDYMVFEGV